jgi:hypothetical protein
MFEIHILRRRIQTWIHPVTDRLLRQQLQYDCYYYQYGT